MGVWSPQEIKSEDEKALAKAEGLAADAAASGHEGKLAYAERICAHWKENVATGEAWLKKLG